jgi:metal transporter CNNM
MPSITAFWTWLGIVACVTQSALFAGLNLAIFSLSQLRLQLEADGGNADAARVLDLRKNSNPVLATVIWGNVSTNVLLTLMSDSVLAGLSAFFFSAIVITLLGEIIPQAYFSRNALRMTARFLPFLNFYRAALFPLAKPTAMLLDWWLGIEGIPYLREREVRSLVLRSAASGGDVGRLEAIGARNFFDLDDVPVTEEGEPVHPQSIISLPLAKGRCLLPKFERSPEDPFLRRVDASGMKWVIVTDPGGEPVFVLDSDHFLRDAAVRSARERSDRVLAPADHRPRHADKARRRHRPHEGRPGTAGRRRHRQRPDPGLGRAEADHHRGRPVGPAAARHRDGGRWAGRTRSE